MSETLTSAAVHERHRDALYRGLDWSLAVLHQIDRVHEAEQAALAAEQDRRSRSIYRAEDRDPFTLMRAEAYYLMTGARQLVRALQVYGHKKEVPAPRQDQKLLTRVRDALEHWDKDGPADRLREHSSEAATAHRFGYGGTVLGGIIELDQLSEWAQDVREYLLRVEQNWS